MPTADHDQRDPEVGHSGGIRKPVGAQGTWPYFDGKEPFISCMYANQPDIGRIIGNGTLSHPLRIELTPKARASVELADELVTALRCQNHLGDPDGGFCNCPRKDGHAPNNQHASSCAMVRKVLTKAKSAGLL